MDAGSEDNGEQQPVGELEKLYAKKIADIIWNPDTILTLDPDDAWGWWEPGKEIVWVITPEESERRKNERKD